MRVLGMWEYLVDGMPLLQTNLLGTRTGLRRYELRGGRLRWGEGK